MKRLFSVLLLSVAALTYSEAEAKVTLPSIFANNMVLQQQSNVAIWGKATPRKSVKIKASWSDESITIKADKDGRWSGEIKTPAASNDSYTITLDDGETTTLSDVLVGEVWLCSGQSNMEMPVRGFNNQPVEDASEIIMGAKASTPIRICRVKLAVSYKPEEDCTATWYQNNPKDVAYTSATAYTFARALQERLEIPVGIVVSTWGGTPIEGWMKREAFAKYPHIDLSHLASEEAAKSVARPQGEPVMLYNAMINPLIPFTFKGMLWYQGESNRNNPKEYARLMPDFVEMIRNDFKNEELPFYFVQIAPFVYDGNDEISSALLREAQLKSAAEIDNSGMVVTLDIGEAECIHPTRKNEVGVRLAHLALTNDYGIEGINPNSPTLSKMEIDGNKAKLTFSAKVSPQERQLSGFTIAGEDRKFYTAEARVEKGTGLLIIESKSVTKPVAVRYAFTNVPQASLFSDFNLPVSSFRTDNWE